MDGNRGRSIFRVSECIPSTEASCCSRREGLANNQGARVIDTCTGVRAALAASSAAVSQAIASAPLAGLGSAVGSSRCHGNCTACGMQSQQEFRSSVQKRFPYVFPKLPMHRTPNAGLQCSRSSPRISIMSCSAGLERNEDEPGVSGGVKIDTSSQGISDRSTGIPKILDFNR